MKKAKIVKDLQDVAGFWVSDSQDVKPINDMLGKRKKFDSFFVLENSPDGCAIVYGMYGIIPYIDRDVYGPFTIE